MSDSIGLMAFYPQIKWVHVGAVCTSGAIFGLRGLHCFRKSVNAVIEIENVEGVSRLQFGKGLFQRLFGLADFVAVAHTAGGVEQVNDMDSGASAHYWTRSEDCAASAPAGAAVPAAAPFRIAVQQAGHVAEGNPPR